MSMALRPRRKIRRSEPGRRRAAKRISWSCEGQVGEGGGMSSSPLTDIFLIFMIVKLIKSPRLNILFQDPVPVENYGQDGGIPEAQYKSLFCYSSLWKIELLSLL